jgi:hypothetical protein
MESYKKYDKDWYLISKRTNKIYKIIKRYSKSIYVIDLKTNVELKIYLSEIEKYYNFIYKPLSEVLKEL